MTDAAYMTGMTNTTQLRRKDRNEPGNPGKYTTKDHTLPDPELAESLRANEDTAIDAMVASKLTFARHALNSSGAIDADGYVDVDLVDHNIIGSYCELVEYAADLGAVAPLTHKEALLLARHPETTLPTLTALASLEEVPWQVEIALARHENADAAILDKLANSNERGTRCLVASHFATRTETLERLARDPFRDVRAFVAANDNTPVELANELARDEDAQVQLALLERRELDPSTAQTLLDTTRYQVVAERVQKHAA